MSLTVTNKTRIAENNRPSSCKSSSQFASKNDESKLRPFSVNSKNGTGVNIKTVLVASRKPKAK